MEAIAKTKHLKGSPRKARLVIDLIRGRNVSQALNILKFTDKRAADPIAKTLRSAIANATYLAEQQNIAIDPDDLWVKTCFVDMGAHKNRRRMRPAPQGRAYREQRHYCHITITVSSEAQPVKESAKTEKPVEAKKAAPKAAKKDSAKEAPKAKKKADKAVDEVETSVATNAPAEVVETVEAAPEAATAEAVENVDATTETAAAETAEQEQEKQ